MQRTSALGASMSAVYHSPMYALLGLAEILSAYVVFVVADCLILDGGGRLRRAVQRVGPGGTRARVGVGLLLILLSVALVWHGAVTWTVGKALR